MNKITSSFFQSPASVFTQADVCAAVAGSDFSRHGLIKRAIAGGEIVNIRRGLYCLSDAYRKEPVDVYSLAQYIYGPSYVSMESALSFHGWIPEAVYSCTSASLKASKEFDTPLGLFTYRRVPQKSLFAGVERLEEGGKCCFMAAPAKALADYIYTHRLDWTGIRQATESLRLDEELAGRQSKEELAELAGNYNSQRVKKFLEGWVAGE